MSGQGPISALHYLVICDIDGCVADNRHRLHHISEHPKDWKEYRKHWEKDDPVVPIVNLLTMLEPIALIIMLTGRHDIEMEQTDTWLRKHNVPFHGTCHPRTGEDYRPNAVIKMEGLAGILDQADGYEEIIIIEDNPSTIEAIKKEEVPYNLLIQPHLFGGWNQAL